MDVGAAPDHPPGVNSRRRHAFMVELVRANEETT
jgi:hypothetical protein